MNMNWDLHTHSAFSDGKDKVVDMIKTAEAFGLDYLALSDHIFEKTDTSFLEETKEAILRNRSDAMQVLLAAEGVILDPDGAISVTEEVIGKLDFFMVDLGGYTHGIFKDAPASKTKVIDNVVQAMVNAAKNPLVDIVAHPFNLGRCPVKVMPNEIPQDLYEEIAHQFAQSGTIFELMNQMQFWFPTMPAEQFLQEYARVVRIFAENNVKFSIGSDAHSSGAIGNMLWVQRVIKAAGLDTDKSIITPNQVVK